MKKLGLLFASAFVSASAFADIDLTDAYWVIKDGRMTSNISYIPYDEDDLGTKVPDVLVDTTIDGENVVAIKHLSMHFLDPRFQFDPENKLNLSTNYMLTFEYKIPSSHSDMNLISEGNKPLFIFGYSQNEKSIKNKNCTKSEAYTMIDAKWGVAGEWVTVNKYIFANPSVTTLEGMIISYAREYLEGDMKEFPCIKNMGFVKMKEGKPFYAENFDGAGLGEFYYETVDISDPYPDGTNDEDAVVTFNGGIKPVITEEYFKAHKKGIALTAFRDFQKDIHRDQDGSGFVDNEILHALQVEADRDSIVFPGIKLPENTNKIYSSMLIKRHKNEKRVWKDGKYDNEDLPILVKFNTGEIVDLAKDSINTVWTKMEGSIDVPAGATSIDLIIKASTVGYLVDEIYLSNNKLEGVKVDQFEANSFDFVAYFDNEGNLVVLNAQIVAVYNMKGAVASKNDKAVVVVVKNDKGQLASKVLVRK